MQTFKFHLILFFAFSAFGFLYLVFDSGILIRSQFKPDKRFVSLNEGRFELESKPYYPVAVNYIVTLQRDSHRVWPSPYIGYYTSEAKFNLYNRDSALAELSAEFRHIREMGFNSIRVTGIGENSVYDKGTGLLFIPAYWDRQIDSTLLFSNDSNYELYFKAIDDLLMVAQREGLRVVMLTKYFIDLPGISTHFIKLASRFKDNPALMAYDVYNEPLYFDSLHRTKSEVYEITRGWRKLMRKFAPNQMYTIGLAGIREVLQWDPNVLDVDFISFHPYEYEPDQVRNEIYWYYKTVKKPWIIGETSLPADNDSVSYLDQLKFGESTIRQTYNCGGVGYTWWQFKDVNWQTFHSSYMGIVNRSGETTLSNGVKVDGTAKPLQTVFKNFVPGRDSGTCICPENYHNYIPFPDFKLVGKVIDNYGNPVEDAVVVAWNDNWQYSFHGVTRKDGTFEVRSRFRFHHWAISATLHETRREDVPLDKMKIFPDGIPGDDIGVIAIERLFIGN